MITDMHWFANISLSRHLLTPLARARPALFCTGQAKGVRLNDRDAKEIVAPTVESAEHKEEGASKTDEEEEEEVHIALSLGDE